MSCVQALAPMSPGRLRAAPLRIVRTGQRGDHEHTPRIRGPPPAVGDRGRLSRRHGTEAVASFARAQRARSGDQSRRPREPPSHVFHGVAPTKAVAKIASDLHKPDGLTVVLRTRSSQFLAPISCAKILGVGPKTAERLQELGLELIETFRSTTRPGPGGAPRSVRGILHRRCVGHDADQVVEPSGPPSRSAPRPRSIETSKRRPSVARARSPRPSLHEQLLQEKYAFRTVGLKAGIPTRDPHPSRSLKIHTTTWTRSSS